MLDATQPEKGHTMAKPDLFAYVVTEYTKGKEKRSFWQRVGVGFLHKDGEGIDVILDALPVSGRVTLRKPKPDEEAPEA